MRAIGPQVRNAGLVPGMRFERYSRKYALEILVVLGLGEAGGRTGLRVAHAA